MSIREMIKKINSIDDLEHRTVELAEDVRDLEHNAVDQCAAQDKFEKDIASLKRWTTITTSYSNELKKQIEEFVQEVQKNNYIVQEEFNAWMNTPWWKMITKKQRAKILGEGYLIGEKKFAETLDKTEE